MSGLHHTLGLRGGSAGVPKKVEYSRRYFWEEVALQLGVAGLLSPLLTVLLSPVVLTLQGSQFADALPGFCSCERGEKKIPHKQTKGKK